MMRVAWATVGAIIGRVVERMLPSDKLAGLTHIGVDELSYRKHHKYVTIGCRSDTDAIFRAFW